jgi:hypothetical protein
MILNGGRYTITQVEARLSPDGRSITSYDKTEHFSSYFQLPEPLLDGLEGPERDVRLSIITPSDLGLRFTHDAMAIRNIQGSYPIVRWRDHQGQKWEHKLGVVRKINENEQWSP